MHNSLKLKEISHIKNFESKPAIIRLGKARKLLFLTEKDIKYIATKRINILHTLFALYMSSKMSNGEKKITFPPANKKNLKKEASVLFIYYLLLVLYMYSTLSKNTFEIKIILSNFYFLKTIQISKIQLHSKGSANFYNFI